MKSAIVYTKTALVNQIVNPRLLLKYRLKELLIARCGCQAAVQRAKTHLSKNYDIHEDVIAKDINRTMGDRDAPEERLQKYAAYLGTTVDNLKNPEPVTHPAKAKSWSF